MLSQVALAVLLIILCAAVPANGSFSRVNKSAPTPLYKVEYCVATAVGHSCNLRPQSLEHMTSPVDAAKCDATWGQQGSVTWTNMVLPPGRVLRVRVTTAVPGQTSAGGFFVRPTRQTREWGRPELGDTSATFYLANTGQFSVEFAPESTWRNETAVLSFPALMLFVDPPVKIPTSTATVLSPADVSGSPFKLGPNRSYIFASGLSYDWGEEMVFFVNDNTKVWFEPGAHVRARIIQTKKKVDNVTISGYGILDNHYEPKEYGIQGLSDDGSRQTVTIYGKNIHVSGITMINSNPKCHAFGYCLNLNANWSPLADSRHPFDAGELQGKNAPYPFHQAHCQKFNMDDSSNLDFHNCPTSHADGNTVRNVKCMTWQMGQDGLNAGKFGTVEDSFVRVIDDAIKPWDSHGIYKNLVVWQLTLGWPINFGWWGWNEPDHGTTIDSVHVIHNHNWISSPRWPETPSGQCIIGGVYGSGAVKSNYTLSNIFVETACSCAVGLQISKAAFSRHLTNGECVGDVSGITIDGIYFDEDFLLVNNSKNFLSGETRPNQGCTGNLSGKISSMAIAGEVAGRKLSRSDFVVDDSTVSGLVFEKARDPDPVLIGVSYHAHEGMSAVLSGAVQPMVVKSARQCARRCHADWGCDCVAFQSSNSTCWKLRGRSSCDPSGFVANSERTMLLRVRMDSSGS